MSHGFGRKPFDMKGSHLTISLCFDCLRRLIQHYRPKRSEALNGESTGYIGKRLPNSTECSFCRIRRWNSAVAADSYLRKTKPFARRFVAKKGPPFTMDLFRRGTPGPGLYRSRICVAHRFRRDPGGTESHGCRWHRPMGPKWQRHRSPMIRLAFPSSQSCWSGPRLQGFALPRPTTARL